MFSGLLTASALERSIRDVVSLSPFLGIAPLGERDVGNLLNGQKCRTVIALGSRKCLEKYLENVQGCLDSGIYR